MVVAATIAVLAGFRVFSRPSGAATPEAAVREFLVAVESDAPREAHDVVPRGDRSELRARVDRFAGTPSDKVRVTIHEPINGAGRTVALDFPDGRTDEVAVVPSSGRWYVRFFEPAECLQGQVCLSDA